MTIRGNIVNIGDRSIAAGNLEFENGRITSIVALSSRDPSLPFILPGFIDAHVHIESSMLVPSEFARLAVVHGTVATISDPHEIANVCGMKGVAYMIENGKKVNFKFHFGAPSCVPATQFETAGDAITAENIAILMHDPDILYLSEMMNFPGVIARDPEVMKKIDSAHAAKKPVDGHAPGLKGPDLRKYRNAGISTDHECFTADEALEKLSLGMKVLVREGSAARNFEALAPLLHDHWMEMMFCSDDKHPDSLVNGHINELCRRAVAKGIDAFKVLQCACINPVLHYGLPVGNMRKHDSADFIIVQDLVDFRVLETYINGERVYDGEKSLIEPVPIGIVNQFNCNPVTPGSLACEPVRYLRKNKLPVIEAMDGQLITRKLLVDPKIEDGFIVSDVSNDILKIAVINRYHPAAPAISFIRNFGLTSGAIASSVAHDSHNIIAVGVDDESISRAINGIIRERGGISCVTGNDLRILPLPVAGLMSERDGYQVARDYTDIDQLAKSAGSTLRAPFMTLSFMALLVIPALKLSDRGLFDGEHFSFI